MTCIAGLAIDGRVWMGGDAAVSIGNWHQCSPQKQPKVFRCGPYLIGVSGEPRYIGIMHKDLKPSKPPEGVDLTDHLNTTFSDELRAVLCRNGVRDYEGNILVGIQGRLFYGDAKHNYIEDASGMAATGSGRHLALGSLAESEGSRKSPRAHINSALRIATRFGNGVEPPFTILSSAR